MMTVVKATVDGGTQFLTCVRTALGSRVSRGMNVTCFDSFSIDAVQLHKRTRNRMVFCTKEGLKE